MDSSSAAGSGAALPFRLIWYWQYLPGGPGDAHRAGRFALASALRLIALPAPLATARLCLGMQSTHPTALFPVSSYAARQQFQPWRACRHSCRPRPHTPPPATPPHAHAHALHAGRAAPASPCGGLHLVQEVLAHALLLKAAHLGQLRKQLAAHPGAEQGTGQGRQLSKEAQQGSSARKLLSWQCCAGDRLACEQGALHQAWQPARLANAQRPPCPSGSTAPLPFRPPSVPPDLRCLLPLALLPAHLALRKRASAPSQSLSFSSSTLPAIQRE